MPPQKRSQAAGKWKAEPRLQTPINRPWVGFRVKALGSLGIHYLQLCCVVPGTERRNNDIFCVTDWQWKLLYTGNYRNDYETGFRALSSRPNIFHGAKPRRYKTFVDKVCLPKLKNACIKYHGKKKKTKIWERKSWNAKLRYFFSTTICPWHSHEGKNGSYSLTVLTLDFNYYLEKTRSAIKPYF